jgi:hypothetical protein|tara:strand:+ start:202 stop:432 length:231 start_codon:yes stop_codon:yes gene_type:complete
MNTEYTMKFDVRQGWIKVKIVQPTIIDLASLPTKIDTTPKNNPKRLTKFLRNKWNRQRVGSIAFDNMRSLTTARHF